MSIAIQGGWGTGKSSFMHLVEKELEDLKSPQMEVVSVRFNTWQYSRSGEERLFIPLVRCLEKKLDEVNKDNKEYTDYFKDRKIIFSGRWFGKTAGKVAEAVPGKTGAALALFGQMMEGWLNTDQSEVEKIYEETLQVRQKLQDRINVMTGRSMIVGDSLAEGNSVHKKLVVFVDDLDRLAPKDAVNLLEDMKNFMDCQDTVFVLALDHNLVNRGVKEKYGDIEDGYENKFFEKIVQLPFFLPTRKYDIRNYVMRLIRENNIANLDPGRCAEYIEMFSERNPRVIKRALNVYQLNTFMMKSGAEASDHTGLFALILLQMQNEKMFKNLVDALGTIMADPATVLVEDTGYQELGKIKKLDDLTCRLKEVFPSFSDLWNELMSSTFAETVSSGSKNQQLDEIYTLLRDYVREKGFKNTAESNTQSNWKLNNSHSIQIKRFKNNANINFLGFEQPQKRIDCLLERGIVKPVNENGQYVFNSAPETFIQNSFYLYIRNVTADLQVLKAVGELVSMMIEEEAKKANA